MCIRDRFYGDSVITPAISVMSAVEGLNVANPAMEDWILPISVAILTMLFLVQRFGTAVVGRAFGPVTVSYTHLDVYKRQPHS